MIDALWTLSWHFGLGGAGVAAAIAFAVYSPVFKKTALFVAAGISLATGFYAAGVVHENAFWQAKWESAQKKAIATGNTARTRATKSIDRGMRDKRDTDK